MNKQILNLILCFGVFFFVFAFGNSLKVNDLIGVRLKVDANNHLLSASTSDATKDRFFFQILDHSDKTNLKTWRQVKLNRSNNVLITFLCLNI